MAELMSSAATQGVSMTFMARSLVSASSRVGAEIRSHAGVHHIVVDHRCVGIAWLNGVDLTLNWTSSSAKLRTRPITPCLAAV